MPTLILKITVSKMDYQLAKSLMYVEESIGKASHLVIQGNSIFKLPRHTFSWEGKKRKKRKKRKKKKTNQILLPFIFWVMLSEKSE